jgi:hypothetical protein
MGYTYDCKSAKVHIYRHTQGVGIERHRLHLGAQKMIKQTAEWGFNKMACQRFKGELGPFLSISIK